MKIALDKNGHEVPDPTPVAMPAGFKRPETLAEQVQRLVRRDISYRAEALGLETFEDAEDFDVDDENHDPSTPYETHFDPILGKEISSDEFRRNENYYREAYRRATDAEYNPQMNIEDYLHGLHTPPSEMDKPAPKSPDKPDENPI